MAVLLANHGAIAVGRDMKEALLGARMAEKGCRTFIESQFLGGAVPLSPIEAWVMHKVFLEKYSRIGKTK
jgi:L-fuculose-phosphate aldolase